MDLGGLEMGWRMVWEWMGLVGGVMGSGRADLSPVPPIYIYMADYLRLLTKK
jgi:hypothetical protein